jgi:hypothetical protein
VENKKIRAIFLFFPLHFFPYFLQFFQFLDPKKALNRAKMVLFRFLVKKYIKNSPRLNFRLTGLLALGGPEGGSKITSKTKFSTLMSHNFIF